MTTTLRTACHPEAGGRQPKVGDVAYDLTLPLEGGNQLIVHMGETGFNSISQFVFDMAANTPSCDDGSLDKAP